MYLFLWRLMNSLFCRPPPVVYWIYSWVNSTYSVLPSLCILCCVTHSLRGPTCILPSPLKSGIKGICCLVRADTCSVMMCIRLFMKLCRATLPAWSAANSLHWPSANAANTYSPRQLVQVIFKPWKHIFNLDQAHSYSGLLSTSQVWHCLSSEIRTFLTIILIPNSLPSSCLCLPCFRAFSFWYTFSPSLCVS